MINIVPGSHADRLIRLLALTGEFPYCSLRMVGNERQLRKLVHEMTAPQEYRNPSTGEKKTVRLLSLSGKGAERTIRFYRRAFPILEWVGCLESYLARTHGHRFSGDAAHRERNHRVAESVAMMIRAEVECRPESLPRLQIQRIHPVIPERPVFYSSTDLKNAGENEANKTMYTRLTGALFAGRNCYSVYNSRDRAMKWNGMGEFKARQWVTELARLNSTVYSVDEAILLFQSDQSAIQTILGTENSREFRFDAVYPHVYFVPMDDWGIRQLRIMTLPDWKEWELDILFNPEDRTGNLGRFESDAFVDGRYVFSFLDGDLARLIRLREGAPKEETIELICYPHQVPLVRALFESAVSLRTVELDQVEEDLLERSAP